MVCVLRGLGTFERVFFKMKIIEPTGLEVAMAGPFGKGYNISARSPNVEVKAGDEIIQQYLRRYEQCLNQSWDYGYSIGLHPWPKLDDLDPLSVPQINLWLQLTSQYENEGNYCQNTGAFLGWIVQRSYNAGMNSCTLDCGGIKPLHNMIIGAKEERVLELNVQGRVGDHVLANSCHIRAQVEECGDYFLNGARHVTATVDTVGNMLGSQGFYDDVINFIQWEAEDLEVTIRKNAGKSVFTGVKNNILTSPNRSLCEQVRQEMTRNKNKNKIFYLHPDGTRELYYPLERKRLR